LMIYARYADMRDVGKVKTHIDWRVMIQGRSR
jgi:hypothetical protein